jgi:hypothetical protein
MPLYSQRKTLTLTNDHDLCCTLQDSYVRLQTTLRHDLLSSQVPASPYRPPDRTDLPSSERR